MYVIFGKGKLKEVNSNRVVKSFIDPNVVFWNHVNNLTYDSTSFTLTLFRHNFDSNCIPLLAVARVQRSWCPARCPPSVPDPRFELVFVHRNPDDVSSSCRGTRRPVDRPVKRRSRGTCGQFHHLLLRLFKKARPFFNHRNFFSVLKMSSFVEQLS